MKFTKEEAVEKLNQVLTNGGKKPLRMSAKTLESQVETLLAFVSDEEMELDAFVEKVKGGLAAINSNVERDNSDFVKKYKEEHPEPKPKETKPEPPEDPNAEVLRRLSEMEKELGERKEQEAIATKRAEIKKYLSDNNVKNEKWIESVLGIATIGKDDDVEEKGKVYLNLYNTSMAGGNTVPPGAPSPGGSSGEDAFKEVRDLRKQRAENEKTINS